MPTKSTERLGCELALASLLALFQELALIRWMPAQVRVLAYFPNLILLAAFLGLGLGCLRPARASSAWSWPVVLLGTVLLTGLLSGVVFTENSPTEHLWLLYADLPPDAPIVHGVKLPIGVLFVACVLCFVPLGEIVGERLHELRARSKALQGYCWDIAGSLVGVLGFTVISAQGTFPIVWFSAIVALGAPFFLRDLRRGAGFLVIAALIVGAVHLAERADRYSPYYALKVQPMDRDRAFGVLANGALHQYAFDLRAQSVVTPYFERVRRGYHRPYEVMGRLPKHALVVGAGTGNDVALLLEIGAESIDAVEIDPVILEFGRRMHPSRPYDSPRVHVINTDARAFLENSRATYDVIVFATLDSMTRLSALSNVRLDNFMYTAESIDAARQHLTPDGALVMYFYVGPDYIGERLEALLTLDFGQLPIVIREQYSTFNRIYLAGPAFEHAAGPQRRDAARAILSAGWNATEIPSDDWPFLYLRRRGLSAFYLSVLGMVAAISASAIALVGVFARGGGLAESRVDWQMFLFGLGFLLLETRAVTQMNLLWGVTWLTSAVVFASILATVLAATLLAQIRPIGFRASALGLIVSLLMIWGVPVHVLLSASVPPRLLSSLVFVGLPIFFAAICFAALFRERRDAESAFGWNLLGAVAGGLLESTSMAIGMRALLLVALLAYLLAFWSWIREERTRPEPRAASPA